MPRATALDLVPDKARAAREIELTPVTIDALRASAAPSWRVRRILLDRSLGIIWGASGSGKTFLTFDLAAAVARGEPWFGHRTRRGGVVYVAGEGHLKRRVEAYCEHHEVGGGDLECLRVLVANLNLLDPAADANPLIAALQKTARDMRGIALVVLDTLNAMMPGGDENSSEDMGAMIASARKIMEAVDCAVVLVHHGGKDEARGARGHSSLKAAVDSEIFVKVDGDERVAELRKVRDDESGETFAFRLRPIDLGPSADPDAGEDERESSCVVEPISAPAQAPRKMRALPKGSEIAFKALREAIAEHGEPLPPSSTLPGGVRAVRLEVWRRRFYVYEPADADSQDEAAMRRAGDARLKRFTRSRTALVASGAVGIANEFAWLAA
jgi:hypothetical protein